MAVDSVRAEPRAGGRLDGRVLIVDDDEQNLSALSRLLKNMGCTTFAAPDGTEGLRLVAEEHPDVILLDVVLPDLTGFDVCRRIKGNPDTRLIPVVLVTGLTARQDRLTGINAGADDFLNKPYDAEELLARIRSLLRLKRYTDELESAEAIILSLAMTVEARDPYTDGHCHRLATYASVLGEKLNLSSDELAALFRGGYLHDVGKIGIPDAVLLKPDRLTSSEYVVMKGHTEIGDRLCGNLRSLARVRVIVRHHHERCDGSGYPDGLRGDGIPLLAQIVAIADTFDAITTTRPYRAALSVDHACEELRQDASRGLLRGDLVDEFVALVRQGSISATRVRPSTVLVDTE